MSLLSSLYDTINDAIDEDSDEKRECAQLMVAAIGNEVGVDVHSDVEGDSVWSHANMLRVLRGVQGLRYRLSVAQGRPQGVGGRFERAVPMSARGW